MKYYDSSTSVWKPIKISATSDTLPVGAVIPFAGETAPTGWLICQGQTVSRTEYSDLFNIIGTTYGTGDGSTTFSIPNYKGRVPVGYDSSDTDFGTLGKTLGEKTHTLTTDEMPSHSHSYAGNLWTQNDGYGSVNTSGSSGANKANIVGATSTSTGGGGAHNNIQPSIVQNFIIKAQNLIPISATVEDSLTSSSVTDALSAKQGKILNDNIDNLIKIVTASVTISSIGAGVDIYDQSADISSYIPDGYSPVGLLGFYPKGTYYSNVFFSRFLIDNTTFYYAVKNTSSYATGTLTVSLQVLCMKSSLVEGE